jgi:hypothetical protein
MYLFIVIYLFRFTVGTDTCYGLKRGQEIPKSYLSLLNSLKLVYKATNNFLKSCSVLPLIQKEQAP